MNIAHSTQLPKPTPERLRAVSVGTKFARKKLKITQITIGFFAPL
jgi:hypothetical protein